MKYIANPVIVDAYEIKEVSHSLGNSIVLILLDNDERKYPTEAMLSRINVKVGDYWVVQEDGYQYINPKDVFERKYRLVE